MKNLGRVAFVVMICIWAVDPVRAEVGKPLVTDLGIPAPQRSTILGHRFAMPQPPNTYLPPGIAKAY